jgi:hypothetical protein
MLIGAIKTGTTGLADWCNTSARGWWYHFSGMGDCKIVGKRARWQTNTGVANFVAKGFGETFKIAVHCDSTVVEFVDRMLQPYANLVQAQTLGLIDTDASGRLAHFPTAFTKHFMVSLSEGATSRFHAVGLRCFTLMKLFHGSPSPSFAGFSLIMQVSRPCFF